MNKNRFKSKKIKKLLVISSTYPASTNHKVPRFVEDQLLSFKNNVEDISITVVSPHSTYSSKYSYPKERNGIKEYRFHYFIPRFEKLTDQGIMPALSENKFNYLLLPPLFIAEFFYLLYATLRVKPDLLYAHWFTPQAINTSIVSFITRTPYVYTTHASDVGVWDRYGALGSLIVRLFSSNAKAITAVSTQTKEKLERFYKKPPKINVIPMGIYLPVNQQMSERNQSILFIGRLTEKKGLQYLLPALAELVKLHPKAHLNIAGDGEMKNKLVELVEKFKLQNHVTFHGFVGGKEKELLLKKHTIMVVPSIITDSGDSEGLPVSLMEGMANSMVCLATYQSGASDIITDGENGFLISQKNSTALFNALNEIFSIKDSVFNKIRENSVLKSKELSWDSISLSHYEIFSRSI